MLLMWPVYNRREVVPGPRRLQTRSRHPRSVHIAYHGSVILIDLDLSIVITY